jgi:hypothetical protein
VVVGGVSMVLIRLLGGGLRSGRRGYQHIDGLETTIPYNKPQQAENIHPPDNHTNKTDKRRHTTTQPRLKYEVLR